MLRRSQASARMKPIHVAAAALNQTPLDWDGNKARILQAIESARRLGVQILCLPELCISGYGCEDAFDSADVHRVAWKVLQEIIPATGGMIVALGLPIPFEGALYNTACLAVDGRIAGLTAKGHLAGNGIHYEPRWFRPWPVGKQVELVVNGQTYRFGDLHYDCGGVKIGFEICEDAWVARRPAARLAACGVDLILNPSASHFAFGKTKVRKRLVLHAAQTFQVGYVLANLVGNEAGRAIYDGHALIASGDELLAQGRRFSFADCVLTTAMIDVETLRRQRTAGNKSEPKPADAGDLATVAFKFANDVSSPPACVADRWETSANVKEEEFARAIALALFDYLRKSRSHGFVVSLSGGADSAACALLVGVMIELAVAELGSAGFEKKLRHIKGLTGDDRLDATSRDFTRRLLTCVYQATRNSSPTTRDAACGVAEAIGAEFLEFDVDSLVEDYVGMVSRVIGRPLDWQSDDLALQNIQARARAPGVWLLANLRGALLLSTSNRSEAAVGYTTMDGDTCGGLSPIAGIDKAFLRHWLRWMQDKGPDGLDPIAELAAVNEQQPTAELRPAESKQTDEDDLMPYDLLDAIERAAIRDKLAPLEVLKQMQSSFEQYSLEQLAEWIERFFLLWCRNQWKRERYAPSFHLDDENLDPKTWCRFPILSGGYARELEAMRSFVAGELEMGRGHR